jgi:hypothetical protein
VTGNVLVIKKGWGDNGFRAERKKSIGKNNIFGLLFWMDSKAKI